MSIFREASHTIMERRAAAEAPEYMQERYECTVAEIRRGNWAVFGIVVAGVIVLYHLAMWTMDYWSVQ